MVHFLDPGYFAVICVQGTRIEVLFWKMEENGVELHLSQEVY
jgi:hypothetical protein